MEDVGRKMPSDVNIKNPSGSIQNCQHPGHRWLTHQSRRRPVRARFCKECSGGWRSRRSIESWRQLRQGVSPRGERHVVGPVRKIPMLGLTQLLAVYIYLTLKGSFSAVSKPNFASKYAFESSRRDLHNALLCTAPKSHFFQKTSRICQNLRK